MTLFRFKVTVAFTCNFCESLEQWKTLFTGVPCNSFCKQFQKNLKKKHLLLRLNTITKQKFVEIFIFFFANSQGRKLTRKLIFSGKKREKKQTNKQTKKTCKHARSLRSFWGISNTVFLFFQFDFINKKNHVMQLKIQNLEIGASFLNNRFAHEGS